MAAIRRDFLPEDLAGELSANEFNGSVAVQARQTLEETRWLLELAAASPRILGVVGWVDLRSPDVHSQLRSFAGNPKLVGVRHIVQAETDDRFLLRPDFLWGISLLEEFDLAYDILIYTRHLPVAQRNLWRNFRDSGLCSTTWRSRRSRPGRSIYGRRESASWQRFRMCSARFPDW